MDALLGFPTPTAYLRPPRNSFPLFNTWAISSFFPALPQKGGFSAKKQTVLWHVNRRREVPRCEMTAGAQVSQASNSDGNGNVASSPENQLSAQEFFESFLRERQSRSDFVSKASDVLWRREVFDVDEEKLNQVRTRLAELQKIREENDSGGFLKLSRAKQWGLGVDGAPSNAKLIAKGTETLQDDRRRAGFLEYEALKRELSLLTATIATFCTIYCGLVISFEVSLSYGIGALGSLVYLKLLFRHVDQLSEENVAEVFLRRRQKKIGIRSSDVEDAFEKVFFGSGSALSSPRLVIPASLYVLWALVHRLSDMQLNLEIAPLMFGFFAYNAALLVQAYRENKDLAMSFQQEGKNT